MKRIILFAAAMLLCVATTTAQVKFVEGDTNVLKELSHKSGKLVFIDLYADWCPPCVAMNRNVFSREDVGKFMGEHFIAAKYNVDHQTGKALSRDYQVSSIPTYLVFNSEGELVGRMSGGMSSEEFIENMKKMIARIKK